MEYRQGVPYDRCSRCGKEFPQWELFYEGIEPDIHSPKCKWCLVKDAQDKFGVDNVHMGNEN